MSTNRLCAAARELCARPPAGASTDADLLGRFLDARDQSAFAELVARHGPAVLAVCRSVLRDPNDADDAAQATFLVLVRRGAAVRDRAALGAWLCRVAWRAANRLRAENARRAARGSGVDPDATPAGAPATDALALAAVMDEIGRLPEVYRLAVLACYATGTSTAEAAEQLGWPKGTLLTRLAWARKRLSDRLTRRGVTLAGGLSAALAGRATSVAAAARLAGRAVPAAAALVAGEPVGPELVSERVLSHTNGVVRAMTGTKLKVAVCAGLLAAALFGLGRLTGTAGADPGDGTKGAPAARVGLAPAAQPPAKGDEKRAETVPAAPVAPGKELVVRRPLGSYTREVAPFGRATLTFTEDRLRVHATVNLDGVSFVVTADADYSLNRESTVYGVINGAEFSNVSDPDAVGELAVIVAAFADVPFTFRARVEDDGVFVKDIKFGAVGVPVFHELVGDAGNEVLPVLRALGGKFKTDPNPDRNPPAPVARPRKNTTRAQGPLTLPNIATGQPAVVSASN